MNEKFREKMIDRVEDAISNALRDIDFDKLSETEVDEIFDAVREAAERFVQRHS